MKSKYHAIPTIVDGWRFDSRLESRYYQQLKLRQKAGDLKFFLRQVPLHLIGKTKLVVDFVIFENDGTTRFVDTKGVMTAMAKLKIRQAEELYPIKIEIVKNAK